jgi:hypothetical protein
MIHPEGNYAETDNDARVGTITSRPIEVPRGRSICGRIVEILDDGRRSD